jgi:hypothetical protein
LTEVRASRNSKSALGVPAFSSAPSEYISARGLGIAIANAALKRDEPGIRLLKPKEAVFCAMKNFKMRALG